MEDDREAGDSLLDLLEDVEPEWGRNEDAVGRPRALLGFELRPAMACADGNGEGVDFGLLDEVLDRARIGIVGVLGGNLVLDAGEHAEFAFDRHVILLAVGVFADLLGEGDILVIGEGRTVDHDGGEAVLDAALADFEIGTMVQVKDDGDVVAELSRVLDGAVRHVAKHRAVRVLARSG